MIKSYQLSIKINRDRRILLVTKDIPANVVAVGNPCRVLREINVHDREYYYRDRKIAAELRE